MHMCTKRHIQECSQQHYLSEPDAGNISNALQQEDESVKGGTLIHWILSNHENEETTVTHNPDKPHKHDGERKPDTEEHTLQLHLHEHQKGGKATLQ